MTNGKGVELMKKVIQVGLLVLGLAAGYAHSGDNRFCGGPASQNGGAAEPAHGVGDQTVEVAIEKPASPAVCSAGYELAKCGDYESAYKIFDKCIAAGYVGAMIWKASALENGAGGMQPDLPAATELLRRAAMSGDSPYATLAKLHYARALDQGKGVSKDQTAARSWFEAAARDGNQDAIEVLRTGR
jgi:TPR repeat protein